MFNSLLAFISSTLITVRGQRSLLHEDATMEFAHLNLNIIMYKRTLPLFTRVKIHVQIPRNIHNQEGNDENP